MFLVMIDVHSKWIEVFCTSAATSAVVIEELRTVLPETVVTDNPTVLISFVYAEFEQFLQSNGIKHILFCTLLSCHKINGLAERAVQIFKCDLKKVKNGTIH